MKHRFLIPSPAVVTFLTGLVCGGPAQAGPVAWQAKLNHNPVIRGQVLKNGEDHVAVKFESGISDINTVRFGKYGSNEDALVDTSLVTMTVGEIIAGGVPPEGTVGAIGTFYTYLVLDSNRHTNPSGKITVSGLTEGLFYQVQLWLPYAPATMTTRFGSEGGATVDLTTGPPWAAPEFITGTFTATGTTQEISFVPAPGSSHAVLAAISVRKITDLPPNLNPLAADVGLWIGEVELNEVMSQAETPPAWRFTPAPFRYTIIMHVDSVGGARLLREATLMQTDTVPAKPVIVTQSALLGTFKGITLRGGKPVGQRWSATNFPPPAEGTNLTGGGDLAMNCRIPMLASDPLNPFRHKYHPDLTHGRTITRSSVFSPTPESKDSRSDHQWTTTIEDSVEGVNQVTLKSRGTVTFTRVSTVGKLNQP